MKSFVKDSSFCTKVIIRNLSDDDRIASKRQENCIKCVPPHYQARKPREVRYLANKCSLPLNAFTEDFFSLLSYNNPVLEHIRLNISNLSFL